MGSYSSLRNQHCIYHENTALHRIGQNLQANRQKETIKAHRIRWRYFIAGFFQHGLNLLFFYIKNPPNTINNRFFQKNLTEIYRLLKEYNIQSTISLVRLNILSYNGCIIYICIVSNFDLQTWTFSLKKLFLLKKPALFYFRAEK